MRCSECGAEMPVHREFCPECDAPTDPQLLARWKASRGKAADPGRSTEELHANRKKLLIGGVGLLLVLGVMGKLSLPGLPVHIDIDDDRKGPAVVEAQQVYDAFREDEHAAAKRFDGREMVVTGEFLRIVPDGYGSLDMRLKTSNPDAPLGVDLAGVAIDDAKKLKPGQRVTVSCQGMGGGGDDPWLRECAIQPAGEASAPSLPSPPAPPPPPPAPPAPGEGNGG